jgi:hypothetical protein
MERHLTGDEIEAVTARSLDAVATLAALRHLDACDSCRARASARMPAAAFVVTPVDPNTHVDAESMIAYETGAVSPADREIIEAHLADCSSCRDAFHPSSSPARQRDSRRVAAIAASVAAIAAAAYVTLNRQPPAAPVTVRIERAQPKVAAPAYAREEWKRLVDEVRATRRVPLRSDLDELRPASDALRTNTSSPAGMMSPAGVVVESTRPEFRWSPYSRAKYVVLLQPIGSADIARSSTLRDTIWTPAFDLERGKTYEWQVTVSRGPESFAIPSPPAPRTLFRILEAGLKQEIDEARRAHPEDHLLLAALYSRAGLDTEAASELQQMRNNTADAGLAADLMTAKNRQ